MWTLETVLRSRFCSLTGFTLHHHLWASDELRRDRDTNKDELIYLTRTSPCQQLNSVLSHEDAEYWPNTLNITEMLKEKLVQTEWKCQISYLNDFIKVNERTRHHWRIIHMWFDLFFRTEALVSHREKLQQHDMWCKLHNLTGQI